MKGLNTDPNELTDELKDQARECKTEEELAELAENNNMDLSLDELDEAAGGYGEKSLGMKPCKVFYGTRDPYYISSRYDDRCPRKDHRVW